MALVGQRMPQLSLIEILTARKWISREGVYTKHCRPVFLLASNWAVHLKTSSPGRSQASWGRGDCLGHNIDVTSEASYMYLNTASGQV